MLGYALRVSTGWNCDTWVMRATVIARHVFIVILIWICGIPYMAIQLQHRWQLLRETPLSWYMVAVPGVAGPLSGGMFMGVGTLALVQIVVGSGSVTTERRTPNHMPHPPTRSHAMLQQQLLLLHAATHATSWTYPTKGRRSTARNWEMTCYVAMFCRPNAWVRTIGSRIVHINV